MYHVQRCSRTAMYGVLSLLLIASGGCTDASAPRQPLIPEAELLRRLVVTPDRSILAVDSTVQLSVTAENYLGEPLPIDMTALRWSSTDSARVRVDANGKVTAKAETSMLSLLPSVTAEWTLHGVTQKAQAQFNITRTQFPVTRLRIVAPDSTRSSTPYEAVDLNGMTWMDVLADTGSSASSVKSLILPLQPVDSLRKFVSASNYGAFAALYGKPRYAVTSSVIGEYWLYTYAWVYGTLMRDSLRMTGLYAYDASIPFVLDSATNTIESRFINETVIVQPCGLVRFLNQLPMAIDIVFDDPGKATGCVAGDLTGNIENIPARSGKQFRKFPATGTVRWTLRNRATGELLPSITGLITIKRP